MCDSRANKLYFHAITETSNESLLSPIFPCPRWISNNDNEEPTPFPTPAPQENIATTCPDGSLGPIDPGKCINVCTGYTSETDSCVRACLDGTDTLDNSCSVICEPGSTSTPPGCQEACCAFELCPNGISVAPRDPDNCVVLCDEEHDTDCVYACAGRPRAVTCTNICTRFYDNRNCRDLCCPAPTPTSSPSRDPSVAPTRSPQSNIVEFMPTGQPGLNIVPATSESPSRAPTRAPTRSPSVAPTRSPQSDIVEFMPTGQPVLNIVPATSESPSTPILACETDETLRAPRDPDNCIIMCDDTDAQSISSVFDRGCRYPCPPADSDIRRRSFCVDFCSTSLEEEISDTDGCQDACCPEETPPSAAPQSNVVGAPTQEPTFGPTPICNRPCCQDVCCITPNQCDAAGINGDPHLVTFDNFRFSCQARGEFVALQSATSGAQIQVRFEKKGDFVSLATAVAVTAGPETRTVQLSIANNQNLQLFIDNEISGNEDLEYEDAEVTVYREEGDYFIFFKSNKLSVRVRYIELSFRHLDIQIRLPPGFQDDDVSGLLGSPDDDPLNDWANANGLALEIPAVLGDQEPYDYCRQNWCITEESDSIFVHTIEANFSSFSGCLEPFPGVVNLGSASPELLSLCGINVACVLDGIELGIEAAQVLLEEEAELLQSLTSSQFTAKPSAVQVGINRAITLSVDLSQESSDSLVGSIEEFQIFRVDSATREISPTSIVSLQDDGLGVGDDLQAGDFVFSNVLAVQSSTAGESSSFLAVPVIAGYAATDSPYARYLLNAVTYYSSESAIGDVQGSVNASAILTRDSVDDLVLEIQYSWPADQPDLDTGTFFLGESVGFGCGFSPYISFSGDDTSTGGIEIVQVALGASFAAGAWSEEVLVDMNVQWFLEPYRGPATITVSTASMAEDGEIIPHNNAFAFVIVPGVGGGCASKPVAQAEVQVNPNSGAVRITISSVSQ